MLVQDEQKAHLYSQALDQSLQAAVGKLTQGISPAALMLAFFDWYFHLAIHPAKHIELTELIQENILMLFQCHTSQMLGKKADPLCKNKSVADKRFADHSWKTYPYSFMVDAFLMVQDWWHCAASNVRGVSEHHEHVVDFTIRQLLDMLSPSNSPLFNPEILQATTEQSGENFLRGFENYMDDVHRYQNNLPPYGAERFILGVNVATTQGKVIYRNDLIELIQYSPMTEVVYPEPILITPAWIMKYYILDLTPKHSLVQYLVKHGHTVFMISWKNPKKKDRNLTMDDYLNLGIFSAMEVVSTIVPHQPMHLVGYCLGGTLAAIAAAKLARDNDSRLASLTIFAAQTDFTEPGELGLFIDESQITFLENMMNEKGYLDTHQMSGAFQLLRSNDLVWSRLIHDYLLGNRKPLTDLMAWNADATRLPYRMHSEYLRKLFLQNQLAEGKYMIDGKPIALTDITIPIFTVATERDHVSPWRSVFKINLLTASDVTFALTSGGHNVGIVSMPVKKTKRYYRVSTLKEEDRYIDPDSWYAAMTPKTGSWWLAWKKWLRKQSGEPVAPPKMGNAKKGYKPLEEAPGSYVHQK